MPQTLLPQNATELERALEAAVAPEELLGPALLAIHGLKYARPLNASVAPWLVQEYGLGVVADYFDSVEVLIDQARAWQRIRGTPDAIGKSLAWIGYDLDAVEDQVLGRRRWHLYQLGMGQLPGDNEARRLEDAEYLSDLSDPARSQFFRGYYGYDVRALSWGNSRFGGSLWGDSSGVRMNGGSVKWSHGREHTLELVGSVDDWSYFGWTDELADMAAASGTWSETLAWNTPMLYWSGTAFEATVKTWLLMQRQAYVAFYDAAGSPIGFARVIRAPLEGMAPEGIVAPSVAYQVRTGFGDGAGATAASIGVVYDLRLRDGVKPFKAWLTPDDVVTGPGVDAGPNPWAHTFQQTVRETLTLTLTFI
ncbi:phage tail protein [Rhizobium halophytocola]|uniref:Uncharacterized protein n=1 Tax=Rhizobium halophytocola TaxID=735519 RepID=A0ABS4E2D7_9HYPH|nr:phage tail protein [Rhizobium halophytocola]MBP1852116.1 hypothetical protein [Rhizobium halophytocola]